ncbi:cupin domain-containing protein [Anaerorudis cellulosivorans]|uniref:cupin domain-containing protein n=1 Tax=Anaerorudis cellulosivorans TaxID=3397862 RepID=UPI00222051E2|nr:cupin domain-containing protein [Seramator thermalis]MCW1734862.1 cupin domain-containing protein [Seramator thermalis]
MKLQSETFLISDNAKWKNAGEGMQRMILGYDDRIMMVKMHFDAKAEGSMHTHPHSQCTYIIRGKFVFTIGDETKTVSAGDALYMAPDVLHGVTCIEEGELIDVFSPTREDFLQ